MQGGDTMALLNSLWPFVLMGGIFYFMLWKPQKKEQQKRQDLLNSLKEGDEIITIGGIYGKITAISEKRVKVEVAEGVVIEIVNHGNGNVVRTADRKFLGVAGLRAGHELVRHEHGAVGLIDVRRAQNRRHRLGVGCDFTFREKAPHLHRPQKRQEIEIHRAVFIAERQRREHAVVDSRDMDAALLHQAAA